MTLAYSGLLSAACFAAASVLAAVVFEAEWTSKHLLRGSLLFMLSAAMAFFTGHSLAKPIYAMLDSTPDMSPSSTVRSAHWFTDEEAAAVRRDGYTAAFWDKAKGVELGYLFEGIVARCAKSFQHASQQNGQVKSACCLALVNSIIGALMSFLFFPRRRPRYDKSYSPATLLPATVVVTRGSALGAIADEIGGEV